MAVVYTKDTVMALTPCLQCLDKPTLLLVLLYILATMNNKDMTTELDTMMEESACYTCLTDKQLLEAMIAILADNQLESVNVQDIRDSLSCAQCADPQRIKAMLLHEWATYWQGRLV